VRSVCEPLPDCQRRTRQAGGDGARPWYLGPALRRVTANLCACAAATAVTIAIGACGGGDERRDADAPGGTYAVSIRPAFPSEQRLGKQATLVLRVRNAGEKAIPNVVVTVRGFRDRAGGSRDADLGRDLWIVDDDPGAAATAFQDVWTAGRLEAGRTTTLRWRVTPVVPGTHTVRYEVSPALAGAARAQLDGGGEPAGAVRVRVRDEPARARVDPRSGVVRRDE